MNHFPHPIQNFKSLLVANRGEIAVRIIKTAKKLGLKTVAVFTDADSESPHIGLADRALCIGEGPIGESYLNPEKILSVAINCGCEAIHPGYGFLSENADFAKLCHKNRLIFVGPSSEAIKAMANKATAKELVMKAGVPCVPGFELSDLNPKEILIKANHIGFPVMVKAAEGGGGRGMRIASNDKELASCISIAKSESMNAFGSDKIIIEKAITNSRHIEVQILSDSFGNYIHLGERDCSTQRRFQKLIEEAPCSKIHPKIRKKMGMLALEVARAINYSGAGTIEFLLDGRDQLYFLEMNTRLQVEHPVTEIVTGFDLVAMQLGVADQQKLAISQEEITRDGYAIEARLYTEDASNDFSPSVGEVKIWKQPSSEGIRVDSGIRQGQMITPFYDGMIAKIIGKGRSREEARLELLEGITNSILVGPKTNRDLLLDIISNEVFIKGEVTTKFFSDAYPKGFRPPNPQAVDFATCAAKYAFLTLQKNISNSIGMSEELIGWSSKGFLASSVRLCFVEDFRELKLSINGRDSLSIFLEGKEFKFTMEQDSLKLKGEKLDLVDFHIDHPNFYLFTNRNTFKFSGEIFSEINVQNFSAASIYAPMSGVIVSIDINEGSSVNIGDRLAVVEAMKMQHELIANHSGKVKKIFVSVGQQVQTDEIIMEFHDKENKDKKDGTG